MQYLFTQEEYDAIKHDKAVIEGLQAKEENSIGVLMILGRIGSLTDKSRHNIQLFYDFNLGLSDIEEEDEESYKEYIDEWIKKLFEIEQQYKDWI